MKRFIIPAALLLWLVSCGGGAAPTAPTTSTPTTFTLTGTVTSTQGGPVNGATVKIGDGPNANRTTTTDGSGHYTLTGLAQSGFTVNFSAPFFSPNSQGVGLTSNQTLDAQLAPIPLFTQSGLGDSVFTMPSTVTRVHVDATYTGSCQNFIVHVSTSTISLINIIIGTCSVADTRSPFSGTYAINNGGTVQIIDATGVAWTFTELR